MKNKEEIHFILVILIIFGVLSFSLIEIFHQVQNGYIPRTTTIILLLLATFTLFILFFERNKR